LQLAPGAFDINVSPDKREVLLVDEGALLDALKAGLHALWEPSRRTFYVPPAGSVGPQAELTSIGGIRVMSSKLAGASALPASAATPATVVRKEAAVLDSSSSLRVATNSGGVCQATSAGGPALSSLHEHAEPEVSILGSRSVDPTARLQNAMMSAERATVAAPSATLEGASKVDTAGVNTSAIPAIEEEACVDISEGDTFDAVPALHVTDTVGTSASPSPGRVATAKRRRSAPHPSASAGVGVTAAAEQPRVPSACNQSEALDVFWMRAWYGSPASSRYLSSASGTDASLAAAAASPALPPSLFSHAAVSGGDTAGGARQPPPVAVCCSLEAAQPTATAGASSSEGAPETAELADIVGVRSAVGSSAVSLASCAANAADAAAREALEREYSRVLSKQHFTAMAAPSNLIGQFNKGFILASLGSDVFLLDQHACDEKFNFERLVRTTSIHTQQLLVPRLIDLTASEEATVLANEATFAAHGFHFAHAPDDPPGRRLRLTTVPFSKAVQFGDEDVRELASLLADAALSGSAALAAVRLPKAVAMHASRACRSSIMIGTSLTRQVMRRVVGNLAELEQPWNCPHGRPTLRHLVDLSQLSGSEAVCAAAGAVSCAPQERSEEEGPGEAEGGRVHVETG
jgi:DNA mismatch repair protein PMS2